MNTYHSHDIDARLKRLETRLCKLMIHMGLDPSGEHPPAQFKDYVPEPDPIKVQNANVLKKMLESLRG